MNTFIKRTTIGSVMQGLCYGFAALLFAASCANDDTVQEGKQKENNIPAGATVFTGTSQPGTTTRTAILNHTKGSGASVNWSSSDKIWVKDDAGTWQQSGAVTFPFTTDKAKGFFALTGTYTGASHDVVYSNKPFSGTQAQVEIKATQTQSVPNNFDHAGESGDCGIATASKNGNAYKFTLNHKAAYLCFIPRTSNEYVKRSKLIKIEIMCDDDIAGTYNMAADGTLTLASGGSKTITVTISSGFTIDNSIEDMSKNAAYAVVAPGTHTFRVRYWLRNTIDHSGSAGSIEPIEGTVTKYVTLNCIAGSIQDITANLNPHDYDGHNYYMWDAQQNYWAGHEWDLGGSQPTVNTHSSNDYPKSNADPRYYNETYPGNGISNPATHNSCKDLVNVNEMVWYAAKGDPRWDNDELWTTMGHLYKGGIWFKKKAYISGFNANSAPIGGDWRTNLNDQTWVTSATLPSVSDANKYFLLPMLGFSDIGYINGLGDRGYYWSSTGDPTDADWAYAMTYPGTFVRVCRYPRSEGLKTQKFE